MTNTDSDLIFYQPSLTTVEDDLVKARFKTPNGKEIVIKPDEVYGLYIISFTSGGQQPKEFDGMFTTVEAASQVVEKYISSKTTPTPEVIEERPIKDGNSKRKQAL